MISNKSHKHSPYEVLRLNSELVGYLPKKNEMVDESLRYFGLFGFMVFNATFNNISVISWRPV
jgi:hypothetical protein